MYPVLDMFMQVLFLAGNHGLKIESHPCNPINFDRDDRDETGSTYRSVKLSWKRSF